MSTGSVRPLALFEYREQMASTGALFVSEHEVHRTYGQRDAGMRQFSTLGLRWVRRKAGAVERTSISPTYGKATPSSQPEIATACNRQSQHIKSALHLKKMDAFNAADDNQCHTSKAQGAAERPPSRTRRSSYSDALPRARQTQDTLTPSARSALQSDVKSKRTMKTRSKKHAAVSQLTEKLQSLTVRSASMENSTRSVGKCSRKRGHFRLPMRQSVSVEQEEADLRAFYTKYISELEQLPDTFRKAVACKSRDSLKEIVANIATRRRDLDLGHAEFTAKFQENTQQRFNVLRLGLMNCFVENDGAAYCGHHLNDIQKTLIRDTIAKLKACADRNAVSIQKQFQRAIQETCNRYAETQSCTLGTVSGFAKTYEQDVNKAISIANTEMMHNITALRNIYRHDMKLRQVAMRR
eukprot:m.474951 g.474951  ORF g.474951 m.474951 type:complete len:411 (+) comp21685_c0_seq1:329-1561(+)